MLVENDSIWSQECKKFLSPYNPQGLAEYVVDNVLDHFVLPKVKCRVPEIVTDYQKSDWETKKKFDKDNPSWKEQCGYVDYLNEKSAQENIFKSHMEMLEWCQQNIGVNPLRNNKLANKIRELRSQMTGNKDTIVRQDRIQKVFG